MSGGEYLSKPSQGLWTPLPTNDDIVGGDFTFLGQLIDGRSRHLQHCAVSRSFRSLASIPLSSNTLTGKKKKYYTQDLFVKRCSHFSFSTACWLVYYSFCKYPFSSAFCNNNNTKFHISSEPSFICLFFFKTIS